MKRNLRIVAVAIGLALALAACGETEAKPTVAPESQTVAETSVNTCRWLTRLADAGIKPEDRVHRFAIGDGHTPEEAASLVAEAAAFCPDALS